MLSKKKNNIFYSFAFRLTVWYSVLFTAALIIVFSISCNFLVSGLHHAVERQLLSETREVEVSISKQGLEQAKLAIKEDFEGEGKNRIFFRILSPDLSLLLSSDLTAWNHLDFPQLNQWAALSYQRHDVYNTMSSVDKNSQVWVISKSINDGKYIIQVGKTIKEDQELIENYLLIFGWSVLVLLICGIILGGVASRKAMSGVKRITRTALDISRDGIHHRVKLNNEGEEIDDLANAFNTMLDRIEQLMVELKDVTNNVAHDLRTPITRIRGLAETMLSNDQEAVGMIVEECDRLVQVINTMLDIAEVEAGLKNFDRMALDIEGLVKKGYEIFSPVAQDKNLQFTFQGSDSPIMILGDAPRLQRVISNLLDNAIKFTHEGGSVLVEVKIQEEDVIVSVHDTGIGIEPSQQPHIFEKFYRAESSRSTPGNGLGLCFAKSMVTSMGGKITFESAPLKGSAFSVRFKIYLKG